MNSRTKIDSYSNQPINLSGPDQPTLGQWPTGRMPGMPDGQSTPGYTCDVYGLKHFFCQKKYPLVLYETTQWAIYIIDANMAANSASKIFLKVNITIKLMYWRLQIYECVVHQFSKQADCWSSSTMVKSQGLLLQPTILLQLSDIEIDLLNGQTSYV